MTFSEKKLDAEGKTTLGKPVEIGVVWTRKEGKQGGIIDWHVSPQNLVEGVYFQLENERTQNRQTKEKDAFNQADNQPLSRDQGLSR